MNEIKNSTDSKKDLCLNDEIIKITLKNTKFTLPKNSTKKDSVVTQQKSNEADCQNIPEQEIENKNSNQLTLKIFQCIRRQKKFLLSKNACKYSTK